MGRSSGTQDQGRDPDMRPRGSQESGAEREQKPEEGCREQRAWLFLLCDVRRKWTFQKHPRQGGGWELFP